MSIIEKIKQNSLYVVAAICFGFAIYFFVTIPPKMTKITKQDGTSYYEDNTKSYNTPLIAGIVLVYLESV